jgi:Helix-turn-helix domain
MNHTGGSFTPEPPGPRRKRMKNNNEAQGYGIYLCPDICRNRNLTSSIKILLGQIRQYAKGEQGCIASNDRLSNDCDISTCQVSSGIATLSKFGLITVTKDKRGRRTIMAHVPDADGSQIRGGADTHVVNAVDPRPKNSEVKPKSCLPSSQNLGGDLNKEKKNNERMTIEEKNTSSSVYLESKTPETDRNSPMGLMALEWAQQARFMMCPRTWEKRHKDDAPVVVKLGVPVAGASSSQDLLNLHALASQMWPDSDPVLSIRQILRACASTDVRRDKLQQYAFIVCSGSLNARGVVRMGGKENPIAFAEECLDSAFMPPLPVEPGSQEDAVLAARYAYSTTANWTNSVWHPCWLEAAGRAKDMQVPLQLYMACAAFKYEKEGMQTPLPWIADSLVLADFDPFLKQYQLDRRNAWTAGPCRPAADPNFDPGEYEWCVGRDIVDAVIQGQTKFPSSSCLRCAAMDLRITPRLVEFIVDWKGTAEELAVKLEGLASQTDSDNPPSRGASCGIDEFGQNYASYIRCAHGIPRGTRG